MPGVPTGVQITEKRTVDWGLADVGVGCWERIWDEMRRNCRDGVGLGVGWHGATFVSCACETEYVGGDSDWLAHHREVAEMLASCPFAGCGSWRSWRW